MNTGRNEKKKRAREQSREQLEDDDEKKIKMTSDKKIYPIDEDDSFNEKKKGN